VKLTHPVKGGQIFCSVEGKSIDVMSCYGCDRMVEVDLDTRSPKVVCVVPAPGEPAPSASS